MSFKTKLINNCITQYNMNEYINLIIKCIPKK